MQRKKYRDASDYIELGNPASFVPVAQMKKFTMKNLVKASVFVVGLFLIYSVYQKMKMVKTKEAMEIDDPWLESLNKDENQRDINKLGNIQDKIDSNFKKYREEFEQNKIRNDAHNDLQGDNVAKNREDESKHFQAEMVDDTDIVADNFDTKEEQQNEMNEKEIERAIEERIADIFEEAVEDAHKPEAQMEIEKIKEADDAEANARDAENEDKPNVKPIKQLEFRDAAKKFQNKLSVNEMELLKHHLGIVRDGQGGPDDRDHDLPPLVTAVRQSTMNSVIQLIASVQEFLPGRTIYVYDLDLENDQKKQLVAICGVRLRLFMKNLFPDYIQNLDNMHWKPLIMQISLAEFGHITWLNPNTRLVSGELAPLVHHSHEDGIMVLGKAAAYSTTAVTHPNMRKFIPTDEQKLMQNPHIEISALMIHNTQAVHENFMRLLTTCAMEKECLAPEGAKRTCDFDFTGRKYAQCHRYDESALNILLKNFLGFDKLTYVHGNKYLITYTEKFRAKVKMCRSVDGISDQEL